MKFKDILNEGKNSWIDKDSWIIMNATKSLFGKNKVSINDVIANGVWNNGKMTAMVIEKDAGDYPPKYIKTYVIGSAGNYGTIGKNYRWTQDTGHGYGKTGSLKVLGFIEIVNGEIKKSKGSGVDPTEKLPVWVFK